MPTSRISSATREVTQYGEQVASTASSVQHTAHCYPNDACEHLRQADLIGAKAADAEHAIRFDHFGCQSRNKLVRSALTDRDATQIAMQRSPADP